MTMKRTTASGSENWPVVRAPKGQPEDHQRRGVVGEALPFQNSHDSARQLDRPEQGDRGDGVGGRHDRAEYETYRPGDPQKLVQHPGDRRGGEQDAADGKQQDRTKVGAKATPAHADAT